ncbi:sensor domain-containing diguanylate cyclase [Geobacter pelophilus]|uniref:diguanylate cyclase n=1 Tax=Geoanaerobacter pelophilus TaxID=60036 RepID=A0AAW4L2K5_9BACT|nr:sensor domain-containing diguanylate cyclase [Geoanaerobacter pelophilus]MBT0665329.1 sensor domain-containing diguanylate cyclase [Geoanaerobacter pelophilus]
MVEKHRKLEAHIQDLTDLIGVARTVVSTLELDQVLDRILDSALSFMGMPSGMLAVYEETSGEMVLHAHSGLSHKFVCLDRWPLLGRGDALTRMAMQDYAIRYSPDMSQEAEPAVELAAEGITAMVCVPLAVHNRPVGILYLYDFESRLLEDRQLNHLDLLASFAAMAIDNASLHSRTKMMALTDALTGLYNNRYFMQVFPHEMIRARRYSKPLSIIMIDVDNFKKLNDTYGHPKGDQVLASLGKILSSSLRASDLSFRYGGEEFAVILPETRLEGAFLVAESLREKVFKELSPLLGHESDRPVTISLGVAGYPSDASTTDSLLSHADACLYKAKNQGKNRVYWENLYAAAGGQHPG